MTGKMADHGPNCVACHDPAKARCLIAHQRADLEAEAARAAAHRQAGEAAREVYRRTSVGTSEFNEVQNLMLHELGTANAIAQGVMMHRAHLDRVEAAHPALRRTSRRIVVYCIDGAPFPVL